MSKGHNKARLVGNVLWSWEPEEIKKRPCVFLSHKREDKPMCKKISQYFENAEIDYYLDELDDSLQQAVNAGDPSLITESIKSGIRESSHMLVVVSRKTYTSKWVPFEVGYGHAAIIDKGLLIGQKADKIKLAILTLKDVSEIDLPDFMQVGYIIRGIRSLNEYISIISNKIEKSLLEGTRIFSHNKLQHPLDDILNSKL